MVFYITIPVMGFWIYSLTKSVRRSTKTDKVLLWFHILDLLMLATCVYLVNQPPRKCDAYIMAEHCEGENAFFMRTIAERYKNMLPDSTQFYVEFEDGDIPQSDIFSETDLKQLKRELEECCFCIGISINNYSDPDYSRLLFRRIGTGMYSFRFYDQPLSQSQRDSLNSDEYLIVYNDSTVFEYDAGAFGNLAFPGKHEFIENLNNHRNK